MEENKFDLDLQSVEVEEKEAVIASGLICTPGCNGGTFLSWCC